MHERFHPQARQRQDRRTRPQGPKLQALREKAAQQKNGGKQQFDSTGAPVKAKTNFAGGKKPNFNRKAV